MTGRFGPDYANAINEPQNAIKLFEIYLKLYERESTILSGLGYSYYLNREFDKAKTILEEAAALDPDNIYALRNLSGILANLGETDKAEVMFKKILEIEPKEYRSLIGLGMIYYHRNDYDKAENCFYQVLDLPIPDEEKEPAEQHLTLIAEKTLKKAGFRVDAVMYLVSAINLFNNMTIEEVKEITFEIATIGQNGLDINNPQTEYNVSSLDDKKMSGLCAVCYMYVGFKIIDPNIYAGIDLSDEYSRAKALTESGIM